MTRCTFVGLLAVGLVTVSLAASVESVVLKRTPMKGQKVVYLSTGSIEVQGMPGEVSSKLTKTVSDVAADGSYTTESSQSDLTFNGSPVPNPAIITKTVVLPSGEIQSVTNNQGGESGGRNAVLLQVYWPAKPVAVGDTWTFTGKKNEKLGIFAYTATMKFLGTEKIGAVDAWKIQEDVKETEGATPASANLTVWLNPSDGSVIKSNIHLADFPMSTSTVSGDLKVELDPTTVH